MKLIFLRQLSIYTCSKFVDYREFKSRAASIQSVRKLNSASLQLAPIL